MGLGMPELVLILFVVGYLLLKLYCLVDIIRSDFKDSTTKLLWGLVVLFIAVIGPLLYLTIGRNSKLQA
ncbi:PLDc N-terminal domain-containing protein [Mucilaginibacter antarcticus]|uniref:PLDc N-terminal domain-containing protein n=1 Tax=Mucilaginibacter antarcticus TaxID=1855725 RepID=A0ABW5XQ77_9SPHI